jgi:AcrR family transcriptional regulator
VKVDQRRALARAAAREVLGDLSFTEFTLRKVAERLDWPLGTLHRAYSVSAALLNDVVLAYERETYLAVYRPGSGGLRQELLERADRWHGWLEDPGHVQLLRYQFDLVVREHSPLAQDVPHARTSSKDFQRSLLDQIGAGAAESYTHPDLVAGLVAVLHDGANYSFLEHGDRARLHAQQVALIPVIVTTARPRAQRAGRRDAASA